MVELYNPRLSGFPSLGREVQGNKSHRLHPGFPEYFQSVTSLQFYDKLPWHLLESNQTSSGKKN